MKVLVKGGGWYGCHVSRVLLRDGHDVELRDTAPRLFNGASGNNPARLHIGAHYPRSHDTRAACRENYRGFMDEYGFLTRAVRTNLYAIAKEHSLLDFGTYCKVLRGEFDFIEVEDPADFGLENVEGAILVGERHIVIDDVRAYFERELDGHVTLNAEGSDDSGFDLVVDCTFCANDGEGVDRYEPCLVLLLKGPTDTAVTVMDGPFASLYPWNDGLCSLSSAKFTPFTKECKSYGEARAILADVRTLDAQHRAEEMIASMAHYYPDILEYELADYRLSIRAMPLSAADTRLVDVVSVGPNTLRIRAGKIAMVQRAAEIVRNEVDKRAGRDWGPCRVPLTNYGRPLP